MILFFKQNGRYRQATPGEAIAAAVYALHQLGQSATASALVAMLMDSPGYVIPTEVAEPEVGEHRDVRAKE